MGFAAIYNVFYVLRLTKIINIFYQMAEMSCASATYCGIFLCRYRDREDV